MSISKLLSHAAVLAICAIAGSARADIQPEAKALLDASSAKLGSAQSVRLVAKHKIDPALGVDTAMDRGPITVSVQRPNKFHLLQPAGGDTRELAYDGKMICLMYPQLLIHGLEPLAAADIGKFADAADKRFGFRPPLAELLDADMSGQMLRDVTTARVAGKESVGWTRCSRVVLEQDGMTTEIWIGGRDSLPRRMRLTFTTLHGRPTWDIRLKSWELNPKLAPELFSKRPAPGSQKVQLLKSSVR